MSKQVRPSPGQKSRSSSKHGRRLCCLLACTVVVPCSCQGSLRVAKECSRLAPYFLTADQRVALCGQATTTAPALCARKAHAAPRLSGSHILELCSGAISELPGLCVAGLSQSTARNLSPDLRVELCRGALSDVSLNTPPAVLVCGRTRFSWRNDVVYLLLYAHRALQNRRA